jgi:hypothetical protein
MKQSIRACRMSGDLKRPPRMIMGSDAIADHMTVWLVVACNPVNA